MKTHRARQYLALAYDWEDTPLGPIWFASDGKRVHRVWFEDHPPAGLSGLPVTATPLGQTVKAQLAEYFSGQRQRFDVPLASEGTEFQKKAWAVLLSIPYGSTLSYAEQANALNKPSAYRAVANANGANVLPVLIPCHRVIASNGGLGGFGPGVDKKKWLLEHEKNN